MAFAQDAANAGTGIGSFLGNLLNPVIGSNTVTTETTTAPSSGASKTTTYVVIGLVVVAIIITLALAGKKATPTAE